VIGGLAEEALRRLAAATGLLSRRVWRVGQVGAPLAFVPREFCSWQHRFDDPEQQYRTLYCAEHPVTCLREVLADLRPNAKARADFEAFQRAQGVPEADIHRPAVEVRLAWRQQHVLAPATVRRDGPLADLDDPALRERLADSHAALLAEHGLEHRGDPLQDSHRHANHRARPLPAQRGRAAVSLQPRRPSLHRAVRGPRRAAARRKADPAHRGHP